VQAMFGGLIAVILLGIYVRLVCLASAIVHCYDHQGCTTYPAGYFNDQMSFALSTIGGLVSALVIAQLAITTPGCAPGANLLGAAPSPIAVRVVQIITIAYILTWVITGFWAFMITMYHPTALAPLTDLAHSWLGLAVAAGYSYFGLRAPSRNS
jgi:hypothetical protein